ncbi:amidohydrolase [Herbidospora yilanensis]|uniref:amidohydrolase n=1 Tax=Herbidospora yilanensis TaxID=354426 RepID=UPI000780E4FA|nr:amidohydrolase [Herbidospora yilanensis]
MTETLFHGGRVFTPGGFAEAVLVRDGVIAAAGTPDEVATPAAEPFDLAGGLLTPGFTDSHVHPVQAGLERALCELSEVYGLDAYLQEIAEYAAAHPGREWIQGGGWDMAAFPGGLPRREQLDFLDRPAYLIQRDHHAAWVNTRALERAGITKHTPDPADGRIERDPDGTPTGVLHEGAMDLVGLLTPRPTAADQEAALLDAQRHLFSLGITGWQDAIVGSYAGSDDQLPTYLSVAGKGLLKARVVAALWWDRARGAEQIPSLVERRASAEGLDRFRAGAVKIMQDGIAENFTAAVIEPYRRPDLKSRDEIACHCGGTGLSYVDPALLKGYVRELDALGFQVHFHAIGERAVREVLDSLEGTDPANRHHIAHLQIITPDDVPRFAKLGAVANLQPLWAAHSPQMDELTLPYLGEPRSSWQYPFGDLVASGARLAAGSDWPVSSADPLEGMHVAVNRVEPPGSHHAGHSATPFLPGQALDLRTIMTAYTEGSAWLNGSPAGVIEPGRPADLVVLDRDPFAQPAGEIALTRVRATFVDGEQVY